jgi:hypothetical protein
MASGSEIPACFRAVIAVAVPIFTPLAILLLAAGEMYSLYEGSIAQRTFSKLWSKRVIGNSSANVGCGEIHESPLIKILLMSQE